MPILSGIFPQKSYRPESRRDSSRVPGHLPGGFVFYRAVCLPPGRWQRKVSPGARLLQKNHRIKSSWLHRFFAGTNNVQTLDCRREEVKEFSDFRTYHGIERCVQSLGQVGRRDKSISSYVNRKKSLLYSWGLRPLPLFRSRSFLP